MNPQQLEFNRWPQPAVIHPSNFVFKSLADFSFNPVVGCDYGCRFCFVPAVSLNYQGPKLKLLGIDDPDAQWGQFALLREWDEKEFLSSLHTAQKTPADRLDPNGHRAILFSSTTDPYQIIHHADPIHRGELTAELRSMVRRSLQLILEHSKLRVRILTRSPLALEDFELFRRFGSRLMFGMSLPTLRNDLADIYEPKAPPPTQRLAALKAAKEFGLNIFVAVSPTYPECDRDDLRNTLKAVAELVPLTIFHEPINVRAGNVARIEARARELGVELRTDAFASREAWQDYAIEALFTVHSLARDLGIDHKLHLWPDEALATLEVIKRRGHEEQYKEWLKYWWLRKSEWPRTPRSGKRKQISSKP